MQLIGASLEHAWSYARGASLLMLAHIGLCHYSDLRMKKLRIAIWKSIELFFRSLFPYALVVGTIGGLGVGAYIVSTAFVRAISAMSPELRAMLLAALATPVVAILSVVITHFYARKREIEAMQRASKVVFYEEFLNEYFDLLLKATEKKPGTAQVGQLGPKLQRKIKDHVAKTARNLMLWGGRDTVRAYLKMRDQASRGPKSETDNGIPIILQQFEDLLFAIRHELGHSNRGVSKGDLLKLFITDLDALLGR